MAQDRALDLVKRGRPVRRHCLRLVGPSGESAAGPVRPGEAPAGRQALWECAALGRCTLSVPLEGVACCAACPERVAPAADGHPLLGGD